MRAQIVIQSAFHAFGDRTAKPGTATLATNDLINTIGFALGMLLATKGKLAHQDAVLLLDQVSRHLSTVPVGTIDQSGNFERGADTMPTVNAPVFAVDAATID